MLIKGGATVHILKSLFTSLYKSSICSIAKVINIQPDGQVMKMYSTMLLSRFILYVLCFTLFQIFASCRSGYVSEVVLDSKFYCDASKINVFKAASEIQCVHKCASFQNCQLLNYGVEVKEQENCEIFRLPHNHKSCKMLKGETNWKALVYQMSVYINRLPMANYVFICLLVSI